MEAVCSAAQIRCWSYLAASVGAAAVVAVGAVVERVLAAAMEVGYGKKSRQTSAGPRSRVAGIEIPVCRYKTRLRGLEAGSVRAGGLCIRGPGFQPRTT